MITIYHNPACSTSRNTLAMIRNSGAEPAVIEYLLHPPSREQLVRMIQDAGLAVRDAIRRKGTLYAELGLDKQHVTDDQLLDAMLAHPILINRPFVVTPKGTRLCRPSELVLDILPNPRRDSCTKEDGEVVSDTQKQHGALLPNIDPALFQTPLTPDFSAIGASTCQPRFLLLYGSVRERSYSRLLTMEAARLLEAMGGAVRVFDPRGLPLPDSEPETHPKVAELHELADWCEGMVWCSPERHGAMTGILKAQIDWIPLSQGAIRPTQGKTLAVMEVSGGAQSFNAVNQMRVLGRWMRMLTIPNQSSVAMVSREFDDAGRMKPSPYYERLVDVMEELFKFTLLTRDIALVLTDRYSERRETAAALSERVGQGRL